MIMLLVCGMCRAQHEITQVIGQTCMHAYMHYCKQRILDYVAGLRQQYMLWCMIRIVQSMLCYIITFVA